MSLRENGITSVEIALLISFAMLSIVVLTIIVSNTVNVNVISSNHDYRDGVVASIDQALSTELEDSTDVIITTEPVEGYNKISLAQGKLYNNDHSILQSGSYAGNDLDVDLTVEKSNGYTIAFELELSDSSDENYVKEISISVPNLTVDDDLRESHLFSDVIMEGNLNDVSIYYLGALSQEE